MVPVLLLEFYCYGKKDEFFCLLPSVVVTGFLKVFPSHIFIYKKIFIIKAVLQKILKQ